MRSIPGGAVVENPPASAGDARDEGSLRGRRIPWSRKWQSAPVFLPGELAWTEEPDGLHSMGSQGVGHGRAHTRVGSMLLGGQAAL